MKIVKKFIKFDLPINGINVKSIDELVDNLTPELVKHMKSGLLVKWLNSRDSNLAENIKQIKIENKSDHELLSIVLDTLGFEIDEQIIDTMFVLQNQQNIKSDKSDSQDSEDTNFTADTSNNQVVAQKCRYDFFNLLNQFKDEIKDIGEAPRVGLPTIYPSKLINYGDFTSKKDIISYVNVSNLIYQI